MKLSLLLRSVPLALTLLAVASLPSAQAASATWNLNPTSNDWNTPTNWTPARVPDGPTDVATFAASNVTTVMPSTFVTLGGIVFEPPLSPAARTQPIADKFQKSERDGGVARTKRQDSFKLRRKSSRTRSESDLADDALTALKEKNLESWLGGRDSNPDNVVQRLGARPHSTIWGCSLRALQSEPAFCEHCAQQDAHGLSHVD